MPQLERERIIDPGIAAPAVLDAYRLFLRLNRLRSAPGADVDRLSRLCQRAIDRADRKQRKLDQFVLNH